MSDTTITTTEAYGGRVLLNFHKGRVKHYYTIEAPGIFHGKLFQPSVTGIIGMKDKSPALVPWATQQFADKLKSLIAASDPAHFTVATLSGLVDVAKDTWRESKQQAADIGTIAHHVFEDTLDGKKVELPLQYDPVALPHLTQDMVDMANNAVDAGLKFIREHDIEVIQAEAPRWSPTYGYIGTGDLIARIDGKLSVADWKTSKRLYPTVRLQLSAYKSAYEEEHPNQEIEQRVAINTGKDGELTAEFYSNSGTVTIETFKGGKHTVKTAETGYSHAQDFIAFRALSAVWRWDRENQGQWSKEAPRKLTKQEIARILNN